MLTDIFSNRYKNTPLWRTFTTVEQTLLVQMYRIFAEQVCPFDEHTDQNKRLWADLQSRISMELGRESLSPLTYNYMGQWNGQPHHYYGKWTIGQVCKTWFLEEFDGAISADVFLKQRVSFIEVAFRLVEERISIINSNLPAAMKAADQTVVRKNIRGIVLQKPSERVKADNEAINRNFYNAVEELNARFRQAQCNLNYHNGFIQIAGDDRLESEIETPFWQLVSAPKWKNVDTDMKEAFDRRDNDDRDPAFYAARALESAIKIISGDRGWTHGKEKGAHNYIDNLSSNGFVSSWEANALKHIFTTVRNPLSHGPGSAEMPTLSRHQTEWVIDNSLSWIKRLIRAT
ncbi:AbiJ-NTD4 domain-containing protein [Bradyrhizobium sp. STM 3566]|uniref:AbiJ-NTD4 domain-containing protein n=1 Tax=Bradyrhizobium sp. STM 3566 TaxID=578928 RepID=UPI00388EC765